jgi:MFS transporter, FHS family, glucose/mannose:H+ symporter
LFQAGVAWKGLAGFFLSGLLLSLPGAFLPVWRYHLTGDYFAAGNNFLAMNLGIYAAFGVARLLERRGLSLLLSVACALACAGLAFLGFQPVAGTALWPMGGLFIVGSGAGLLNIGVFRAITPLYRYDPAATINLGGALFGAGSMVTALLVAGTYYVYTVAGILILLALVPGFFIPVYARARFASDPAARHVSLRQAVTDFRSPAAVLFALLLFFQFGNEWAVAGWLPLFLIQRIGISPESSEFMLATYWAALLVGRVLVFSILPAVRSTRLLMWSVLSALFGCLILTSTNNRFGAVVGILLVGAGFASIYPLVAERIGGRFPHYHPGFFNGIFSVGLTGGMLAPWSLGLFTSWWGIGVAMSLPLAGTLMVCLLLLLLWAEAKFGRSRSE